MDATTNGDGDDIIELDAADADPLAGGDPTAGSRSTTSPVPISIEEDGQEDPMVIKGTNSKCIQQGKKIEMPGLMQAPKSKPVPDLIRIMPKGASIAMLNPQLQRGMQLAQQQMLQQSMSGQITLPPGAGMSREAVGGFLMKAGLTANQIRNSQSILNKSASPQGAGNANSGKQPSVSITPLARQQGGPAAPLSAAQAKQQGGKPSFVICEIWDSYFMDLDQLRIHLQYIHKVKIRPEKIHKKPPLACIKCQFKFFTDQGLERHLLGWHGLVTSSVQDAADKGQDSGRCSLCGKVYQSKLVAHVAEDHHHVTLKPAHLCYKCLVCDEKFGKYTLFESHVYSAHNVPRNAPRGNNPQAGPPTQTQVNSLNSKGGQMQVSSRTMSSGGSQGSVKPLKINDEINVIPHPMANSAQGLRKGSLTITPQAANSGSVRGQQDEEGIDIITIEDSPERNERSMENCDSSLRKRNLEISVGGTDDSSDESHSRGLAEKRICLN